MLPKNVNHITIKDRIALEMRLFIYDSYLKPDKETTQGKSWISFPNFPRTFANDDA